MTEYHACTLWIFLKLNSKNINTKKSCKYNCSTTLYSYTWQEKTLISIKAQTKKNTNAYFAFLFVASGKRSHLIEDSSDDKLTVVQGQQSQSEL